MKQVFADRFKSARLLNGFSLQDLADKLDNKITRQALHKYEKGDVLPEGKMIQLLSKALRVNPDYFFTPTKISIGKIEYRKITQIGVKEDAKIVEQTRDYLERYLELEEILGIPNKFDNCLKGFKPITEYSEVNDAAKLLRKEWGLGTAPLSNVMELLEDKHIKVVKLHAEMAFDGLQTWVNKSIPVIAYNSQKLHKSDRIRFTLLHELGHLLLRFGNISKHEIETLCHQFAGAMLLPEKAIKQELGEHRKKLSIAELGSIKKQYGVSMQAIVMRAKVCGIINENYTSNFFFMMNQMNWRIDEPIPYEGKEESNRFDQLLHRALAEEQIDMSKAANLKNQALIDFRKEQMMLN